MPGDLASELDAAIFDLGGVLTTPVLESFADFEQELGLKPGELVKTFREHYSRTDGNSDFHLLETGQISEAEYYSRLGARLGEMGSTIVMPEDPAEVRKKLWGRIRRNDEMIETARRISEHYKVGLLTNNVKEWGGWREFYPTEVFQVVVDSSEVGMRKPDPRIYHLTCERLGVDPGRAAFVDDIEDNVAGARAVGLTGIRFTTTGEVIERLRPLFPKAFSTRP
ncbi:MAG: HAD family hydrolase [Actinomycetota bacterium]